VGVQIVLLRGINLGPRNRIAMQDLREALADAGFENVRTYVQSGNVVLTTKLKPQQAARAVERAIVERFGLEISVVVRTRDELARVVEKNPLRDLATNPKRYQVNFLERRLDAATVAKLEAAVVPPEQLVVDGREVYAWHDAGVARSKLWATLADRRLGVAATARNWTTVTKLLELAEGR
jgi:uncharacterized protein (DUF1697 family)